jgi:hypothetical protein
MYKERAAAAGPSKPPATVNAAPGAYRGAAALIAERRQKEFQEKLARELNKRKQPQ